MKQNEPPTWVKVGDKIATKVIDYSETYVTRRSRYYGTVSEVRMEYQMTPKGWHVFPWCYITGAWEVRKVVSHIGRWVESDGGLTCHGIEHHEQVKYENFLRVLTESEWTQLEAAGWPYDLKKFEKVFKLEAELAKAKGITPNQAGLRVVKGGV